MNTFRVEVVEIKTGNVVSVIGKGLTEKQAEKRTLTGLCKVDTSRVFVRYVEEDPDGSAQI
jgi:hypothetical protein